jgi:Ca2+-binding EF-hand superfamily protein
VLQSGNTIGLPYVLRVADSGSISFDKFVALMARQNLNGSGCDDIDDDELHQVFDVFDSNADGLITAGELAEVLGRLGENMSEVLWQG